MFMSDVHRTEEIRSIALQNLRKLGVKYRPKKLKHEVQADKKSNKVFKQRLHSLQKHVTTLRSGQQLLIPEIVDELCSFILSRAETEGLFRKAGSRTRQKDIILLLERGGELKEEHHEIDVANVLKTFLRELPEPLIPYSFHDLFLKCIMLKQNQLEAVLLACLLLPVIHLNTLAFIMQFLSNLTEYSVFNKMDAYNLAIVMGPTVLPVEEKLVPDTQLRLSKICELTKLMIENANELGFLPEKILAQIEPSSFSSSSNDDVVIKKKKKRRSGSLTRMFSGLKKYVGSKIGEEAQQPSIVTPDLLLTPCITRSSKKRKVDNNGFSAKKKRELLHSLPQNTILSTPFTPHRTPISVHPNIDKNSELSNSDDKIDLLTKEKKYQWYSRSKISKTGKSEGNCAVNSKSTKTLLERRWSAVNNAANFRKNKKRTSCAAALQHKSKSKQIEAVSSTCAEPDYVRISKSEYEEIKSRVSAIERRISVELESVKGSDIVDVVENITDMEVENNPIEHVQTAYEQTLEQTEPLSPTTDHLARRLSRELKIRRSAEQMIFRSPSARKIGSLKRRSRELERNKLNRNLSWHFSNESVATARLKRGSPNTVLTGLPYPIDDFANRRITRSSSLNNKQVPLKNAELRFSSGAASSASQWTSAEEFFETLSSSSKTYKFDNCRASLVRLRNQNAGMVQAKAKLFNEIISDKSASDVSQKTVTIPRAKVANKMGSSRNADKVAHRVRTLRYEDRHLPRKSMSPRKKLATKKNCKQYAEEIVKNEKSEKENRCCKHTTSCDCSNRVNLIKSPLKDCNRIDLSDPWMKTAKAPMQLI